MKQRWEGGAGKAPRQKAQQGQRPKASSSLVCQESLSSLELRRNQRGVMEGQGARAGLHRGLSIRLRDWDFDLRELGKNGMMVGAQGQPWG